MSESSETGKPRISPKVFISYSWTSQEHQDWTINLAQRLVSDGIDVVIDKWNLTEGQDKFSFMETMVNAPDIKKVLIILDRKYAEKADQREGGVGIETQIITPEIYGKVSQNKFVPVVSEKDELGDAFAPTYLKSRLYIDLSEQEHFETHYEVLLRNIYECPAYIKPKLGTPPNRLFEESPISYKTSNILRSFESQINKAPQRVNFIFRDFLDVFYENLKKFSIHFSSRDPLEYGKAICDNLNAYVPLRNDYIEFIDKLTKSGLDFDSDILVRFFEKIPLLTFPQDGVNGYYDHDFDNFRIMIHELFLYSVAVGLRNEDYDYLEALFHSGYLFQEKSRYNQEPQRFNKLYYSIESIDAYYKQTYSTNFLSSMADFMIKRIPDLMTVNEFADADLLCYYIDFLNTDQWPWFPMTYIYKKGNQFSFFNRLVSLRHFEKVKSLLGIQTVRELQDKLRTLQNNSDKRRVGYSGSFEAVTPLFNLINIEKIGTMR